MELEFAFFDSQILGSTEDGKLKQSRREDTARLQSSRSVQLRSEGASDHERFRGVHQWVALLCVDFDDTLTDGDTTSLLVETAKAQVRVGRRSPGIPSLSEDTFSLAVCVEPILGQPTDSIGKFLPSRSTKYDVVRSFARQRGTPEDQAAVEHEWAMLTRAFLSKWSEVMEESLAPEVIAQYFAAADGNGSDTLMMFDF